MVVVIVIGLWGWMMWGSNPGINKDFFFLFKSFLPSGPHSTWYYLLRIKRSGSKFDHSLPSIAKIKNGLNCKYPLPYALTACI
jgi:hypothetical protein